MSLPVTVTVITRDEEGKLGDCLSTLAWADEVLVLDSGSTDRTVAIAESFGATVHREGWRGFAAQKNRAAELARNDWILNVDADERVDLRLVEAIRAADFDAAAFRILREHDFLWHRHRPAHRGATDSPIRLYDRRLAEFAITDVHEKVETSGEVRGIPGTIYHEGFRSVEDLMDRMNRYSSLAAKGRPGPPSVARLLMRPVARVLFMLFRHGHWRDGRRGVALSMMWGAHDMLLETKRLERELPAAAPFDRSEYYADAGSSKDEVSS